MTTPAVRFLDIMIPLIQNTLSVMQNLYLQKSRSKQRQHVVLDVGGASVVDQNKCIGCGICTTKCEFDAIKLHRELPGCSKMVPSEDKLKYILPNGAKQAIKIKFSKKK